MKFFQTKLFFVFITGAFLLAACGKGENSNQNTNQSGNGGANIKLNPPKDDIEEFGKIVNLTLLPEEAVWRETNWQNKKKLLAVLKFSAQNAQTVAAQAEKLKPAAPSELDAEDWFPPELIAKSQESGNGALKGNAYAANDFFLNSYNNGKITRIGDTNYFVLELTANQ